MTLGAYDFTQPPLLAPPTGLADLENAAFSPYGDYLVVTQDAPPYLSVLDTRDWEVIAGTPAVSSRMEHATFSPNGAYLAVDNNNGTLTVYEVATWAELFTEFVGFINAVEFSPDSATLVVGRGLQPPRIRVFNTADWTEVVGPFPLPESILDMAFSPDGGLLVVTHYVAPQMTALNTSDWSMVAGTPTTNASGKIEFSPMGGYLAIATGGTAPELVIYATDDWSVLATPSGSPAALSCLAFTPDGAYLAASHRGVDPPYLLFFDTITWGLIATPDIIPEDAANLAFRTYGDYLAITGSAPDYLTVIPTRVHDKGYFGPELIDYDIGALGNPNPPDLGTSVAAGNDFYRITTTSTGGSGNGIHVGTVNEFLAFGKTYRIKVEVPEMDMLGQIDVFRASSQYAGLQLGLGAITEPGIYTYDVTVNDGNNCITLRMNDLDGAGGATIGDTAVVRVSIREPIPMFTASGGLTLGTSASLAQGMNLRGTAGTTFGSSAALAIAHDLRGTGGIVFEAEGHLSGRTELVGSGGITFGASAALAAIVEFVGEAGIAFGSDAALDPWRTLGSADATGLVFATRAGIAKAVEFAGEAGIAFGSDAELDPWRTLGSADATGVIFASAGRMFVATAVWLSGSSGIAFAIDSTADLNVQRGFKPFSGAASLITFHTSPLTLWITDDIVPPEQRRMALGAAQRDIPVDAVSREIIL